MDSFFVRAGDVLQAGLVFTGERLAFAVPAFAGIIVVLSGVWLGVVVLLNRQMRHGSASALEKDQNEQHRGSARDARRLASAADRQG